MVLAKWDPLKDFKSLQKRIDSIFEDTFMGVGEKNEPLFLTPWIPAVDIYETKDEIVLKAEIPGIEKDKLNVDVKNGTLTIKGERNLEKEVKNEDYYRIERSYGSFTRAFSLPSGVDQSKVKASYKDGILEVKLPKVEEAKPKQIKVEIE